MGRYGHGQRHSLRGLGNFRIKTLKCSWGLGTLLMSSSNSEGQIKLTSKAWRQLLDLVQNCPALQLYCVEADHNSTMKVLLTNNAGRSQMKMLSTWMWSQLQTTSANPPPLSSSIRWLIHVFLCLLYYTVLYHFGMQGHWIVSSLSMFLSCTMGRKQTGLF